MVRNFQEVSEVKLFCFGLPYRIHIDPIAGLNVLPLAMIKLSIVVQIHQAIFESYTTNGSTSPPEAKRQV